MVFAKLFNRRRDPVTPPRLSLRRVLVEGITFERAVAGMREYEAVTARAAPLVVSGLEMEGWVAVDVPLDAHAYHFHNLATWMGREDDPLLLVSVGEEARWCYYLTRDPVYTDFVTGRQHDGTTMSVLLSDQRVVRGEELGDDFPLYEDFLRRVGAPQALVSSPLAELGAIRQTHLALDSIPWTEFNPSLEHQLRLRSERRRPHFGC